MTYLNLEIKTPDSFWKWIQKVFTDLFTPAASSLDNRQWRHFQSEHIFEKHWRYSRANHGVDRSMWIL